MSKECKQVITGFYQTVERGLYQHFLNRQPSGDSQVTFEAWRPRHSPFVNEQPREAV